MRVAIVRQLTPRMQRRVLAAGPFDLVAVREGPFPSELGGIEVARLSFQDDPEAFLDYWGRACDWIQIVRADISRLPGLKRWADAFGAKTPHGENAVLKMAMETVEKDFQMSVLALRRYPRGERVCFVDWPDALASAPLGGTRFVQSASEAPVLKAAARWAGVLLAILAPLPRAKAPVEGPAFLFDQSFPDLDDPEFLALYRYFKTRGDILYHCPANADKLPFLAREGKPAFAHRWTIPLARKPAELSRALRLGALALFDRSTPAAFKVIALRVYHHFLRFASLLDCVRPRRYLRVRFDLDAAHPLVTDFCERLGIEHVGYSDGVYPMRVPIYSVIDFHVYGTWGRHFREKIFRDAWPGPSRWPVIGPFTTELDLPASSGDARFAAVMPTSTHPEFYLQPAFREEFLRACADAFAGRDLSVIVKEKVPERLEAIAAAFQGRLDYRIAFNTPQDGHLAMRTPELVRRAEICVTMAGSTVGWEALAIGRKSLAYAPPWFRHPFEDYVPELVCKDPASLKEAVARLLAMPQEEYAKLIRPLIEHCAKASDGNLVKDFIESIEHGK